MASRFVVAVALFAVCHSSPVLKSHSNEISRNRRSYTVGEGSSSSNGRNTASAIISGGNAQAYGSNDNAEGAGLGQAYAKVLNYDTPEVPVVAKAQPVYYPVPAPATVYTYQKYADVPADFPSQIVYNVPQSHGPSVAQSSASTRGDGSAASNANTGYNTAASNAKANGYGSASSFAQNNDVAAPVIRIEEPSIIAAKTVYTPVYTPAGYGSASSNANVNGGHGSAASYAKTGVPTRKSISWRFGTAYDLPASYAKSTANNYASGSANANADVNAGYGSLKSDASSSDAGSAQSIASTNGAGFSSVNSAANSNGGYANSNAGANNAGYALRSGGNYRVGYDGIDSSAKANGYGSANSNANINNAGHGSVNSNAKSYGHGNAQSAAHSNPGHGLRSTGWGGSRATSDAQSNDNFGNASSYAKSQGLSTGYRVVNSNVNTYGSGSAHAGAQSL